MSDDLPVTVPAPAHPAALDRAAVERVLARAAELQLARAGGDGPALSEADVLAAAREAGIAPEHVRLALAEERLRAARGGGAALALAPDDRGLAARVAGPAAVAAERVVAGPAARAVDAVGAVLEREECMRLVRRTGGGAGAGVEAAWEPRRDVLGNLARGLRGGGRGLRQVPLVRVVALPAGGGASGDERVLVRVEADLAGARRQRLAGAAVLAGTGAAAGGSVLTLGLVANALLAVVAPVAAVPVLAAGSAAWVVARGHRDHARRAHAALERVLDLAEAAGPAAPRDAGPRAGALLGVLDEVRRALR